MGGNKILATGVSMKWVKSRRRRKKKEEKEERKKKVGENNGQLRIRPHGSTPGPKEEQ